MNGQTRPKLSAVKKAETFDDQKTAVEIAEAEATATTQESFQHFILSQLKRLIHGNDPGRWFDDPVTGSAPLAVLSALVLGTRVNVTPVGALDGANRIYTLPDKALYGSYYGATPRITVYHNGRRLRFEDYAISESEGAGTGYDTIRLLWFAPSPLSTLRVDYVKKP